MTRLRAPKLKTGELRIYWGREPCSRDLDVIFAGNGDQSMRADSRMLHCYIASRSPDPFATPLWSKMRPSLLEELDARGYDLTTLKFSIQKKKERAA